MDVPLFFNGREYRLSADETEQLALALAVRGEVPRPAGMAYRQVEEDTFATLAERLREALGPPVSPVELHGHEAAAIVLALLDVVSPELERFYRDYTAENPWTKQPFSHVTAHTVGACFAFKIGQWFFEDGLVPPIGGIDDETGEDLRAQESDFAAHAAANAAFAEVASMWARLSGATFADPRVVADDMLVWLRSERGRANAAADAATDPVEQAEAGSRAWSLREAALWLESCANRARRPWEAPRHEA